MINKAAAKGTSFRGVLDYALDQPEARVVAGNMAGRDARALSTEFAEFRRWRPSMRKIVFHGSCRLAPGDRNMTDLEWSRIAQKIAERLGYGSSSWVGVVHRGDDGFLHLHIVGSRVNAWGQVTSHGKHPKTGKEMGGSNEGLIMQQVARELEKAYGLKRLRSSWDKNHEGVALPPFAERPFTTRGEKGKQERTGKETFTTQAKRLGREEMMAATGWGDLVKRLAKHNLVLRPQGGGLVVADATGKSKAVVKASAVARGASRGALETRFDETWSDYQAHFSGAELDASVKGVETTAAPERVQRGAEKPPIDHVEAINQRHREVTDAVRSRASVGEPSLIEAQQPEALALYRVEADAALHAEAQRAAERLAQHRAADEADANRVQDAADEAEIDQRLGEIRIKNADQGAADHGRSDVLQEQRKWLVDQVRESTTRMATIEKNLESITREEEAVQCAVQALRYRLAGLVYSVPQAHQVIDAYLDATPVRKQVIAEQLRGTPESILPGLQLLLESPPGTSGRFQKPDNTAARAQAADAYYSALSGVEPAERLSAAVQRGAKLLGLDPLPSTAAGVRAAARVELDHLAVEIPALQVRLKEVAAAGHALRKVVGLGRDNSRGGDGPTL